MSLLPSRPDAEPAEDAGPRVIGVDDADADDVLAALSSGTARSLLAALHDEPAAPSELADRVDTSLQNVQYHLEKLEGAGAVEVVDTAYSAKGREMDLYAPADRPLVIFAGDEERGSTLRTALQRLLGAVGLLAAASLLVQAVYGTLPLPGLGSGDGSRAPAAGGDGGAGGGGGDAGGAGFQAQDADGADAVTETATRTATDAATSTPTPAATGTPADAGTEAVRRTATETVAGTRTATDAVTQSADTVTQATEPTRTMTEAAHPVAEGAAGLPPGLLFFAGGLFAILVVAGVLYVRGRT